MIALARQTAINSGIDTFETDLVAHRLLGRVLESPDYYFCYRHVHLDWTLDMLRDPWMAEAESDFVWVWAASGDWRKAALKALANDSAQWVGFDRRGRPHFHELARLIAKHSR